MLYAGVDTHKKYSRVVVTDNRGAKVAEASLANDSVSFRDFFLQLNEPTTAVVEAGRTWGVVYDLLEDMGIEPVLANPIKTRPLPTPNAAIPSSLSLD
jgi:transposase